MTESAAGRPPKRKPLILEWEEHLYLSELVNRRVDMLKILRPSSKRGKSEMKLILGIRKKLWNT